MSTRKNSVVDKQTQSSSTKCHLLDSYTGSQQHGQQKAVTREWVSRYVQNLPLDALVCDAFAKFVKRNTGKTDILPCWLHKEKNLHSHAWLQNAKEMHVEQHPSQHTL